MKLLPLFDDLLHEVLARAHPTSTFLIVGLFECLALLVHLVDLFVDDSNQFGLANLLLKKG